MLEIVFIYPTPEGSQEFVMEGESLSLGRGSDADLRLADDGLSRLNSTIYREGEQVYILDENSTNGTFVNGVETAPNGTILKNGDEIRLGHQTTVRVKFRETSESKGNYASKPDGLNQTFSSDSESQSAFGLVPILLIGVAVFVIFAAVAAVGAKIYYDRNHPVENAQKINSTENDDPDDKPVSNERSDDPDEPKSSPTPKSSPKPVNKTPENVSPANDEKLPTTPDDSKTSTSNIPADKTYQSMSDEEKRAFVARESERISKMIGNSTAEAIPPEAVTQIMKFVNGYIGRIRSTRTDNCSQGVFMKSDLTTVYERASKNAPFVVTAFNEAGLAPQLGLYVAMIESEHCACLESPTHALGMFQFLFAAASESGLNVSRSSSSSNGDERCDKMKASVAATKYLRRLEARVGTGSMSVPLAIAAYNSGQGAVGQNMLDAISAEMSQERSFWTLVANQDRLGKYGKQFRGENAKYVPKFFATAIIGENPRKFGINLNPLSTYTK